MSSDERTVIQPAAPPVDATVALGGGGQTMALDAGERTQMVIASECPVCHTPNPSGEVYCADCGFLLASMPGEPLAEETGPQARLSLADGREFPLNAGRNVVGRQNADVLLADATISRQHAAVSLDGNRCSVEDLGSTNGTSVNGQRLPANQPRDLADGDEVTFGGVALRVALPPGFVAPTSAPAPAAEAQGGGLPLSSPARLVVEETGSEYPLPAGTTTLGRRSANAIAFTTDAYMSGRHAELRFDGQSLTLTDLGSTNGTVVNGDKLAPQTPTPLHDGDLVLLGQQRFRVRLENEAAAAPEAADATSVLTPAPNTDATFLGEPSPFAGFEEPQ